MTMRIAVSIIALAAFGLAHDKPNGKAVTITGTVVDTGCYMSHDAISEKHIDCAMMCAKNGVPLAIVDAAGKVYMPVAAEHTNQNVKLMPFVEKKVKVTGTLLEKGGLAGLTIKTIEAAQ
jgi:hypothetical protein